MDRQEILDAIVKRVNEAGGMILTPVKELADELGEKQERLYYLIRSFQDKGHLITTSRGPKGMEIRLALPENAQRRGRRGAAPRTEVAAASTGRFCPFCGRPAEPSWRFCASCGEQLPSVTR